MFRLRLAVVSTLLLAAVACNSYPTSPSATPSPEPTGPSSPVAIRTGAATLGNQAFSPDTIDVPVGSAVTWTNTDAQAHTSTSDAVGWDSGTIAPGGRFSYTFQAAGQFKYHCAIHPGMVGTVVVH